MKAIIKISLLSLLISSQIIAQTEQGNWELSTSVTAGLVSESSTRNGETNEGESESYFLLAIRPGYFVADNFEIEPEFMLTAIENIEPGINIALNLAYNFDIPESNVIPFVLAGYGFGNAIPLFNSLVIRQTDSFEMSHLNLGFGLKTLLNEWVALRVEYRFQSFSYDTEYQMYDRPNMITEHNTTFHKLLLGISMFL